MGLIHNPLTAPGLLKGEPGDFALGVEGRPVETIFFFDAFEVRDSEPQLSAVPDLSHFSSLTFWLLNFHNKDLLLEPYVILGDDPPVSHAMGFYNGAFWEPATVRVLGPIHPTSRRFHFLRSSWPDLVAPIQNLRFRVVAADPTNLPTEGNLTLGAWAQRY